MNRTSFRPISEASTVASLVCTRDGLRGAAPPTIMVDMKRPRGYLILLFLVAYLAIGAVAGTRILCIEADGRTVLEDAAHCQLAQLARPAPLATGAAPVVIARAAGLCDSCVDVALHAPASWSPGAVLTPLEARPVAAFLDPVLLQYLADPRPPSLNPARVFAGVLAYRRTVVLLS